MPIKVAFSGSRFKYFKDVNRGGWLVHNLVWKVLDIICECVCRRDLEHKKRLGLCTDEDEDICLPCIEVHYGSNPLSVDAIVSCLTDYHPCVDGAVPHPPKSWKDPYELLKRNRKMVDESDLVVCIFVDQITRGTKYVLEYAKKRNKPYIAYFVNTEKRIVRVYEYRLPRELEQLAKVPEMLNKRNSKRM